MGQAILPRPTSRMVRMVRSVGSQLLVSDGRQQQQQQIYGNGGVGDAAARPAERLKKNQREERFRGE